MSYISGKREYTRNTCTHHHKLQQNSDLLTTRIIATSCVLLIAIRIVAQLYVNKEINISLKNHLQLEQSCNYN
jgi:hypothetical protein